LELEKELRQNNINIMAERMANHCFVGLLMKQDITEQFYDRYRQKADSLDDD